MSIKYYSEIFVGGKIAALAQSDPAMVEATKGQGDPLAAVLTLVAVSRALDHFQARDGWRPSVISCKSCVRPRNRGYLVGLRIHLHSKGWNGQ